MSQYKAASGDLVMADVLVVFLSLRGRYAHPSTSATVRLAVVGLPALRWTRARFRLTTRLTWGVGVVSWLYLPEKQIQKAGNTAMKRMILISAFFLITLAPGGAIGENYKLNTGYDLYHATLLIGNPSNHNDLMVSFRALGYIGGFVDGIIFSQDSQYNMAIPKDLMSEKERTKFAKLMNLRRLNIPKEGIAIGQTLLIFQKWAKNHPEELNSTMRLCLWLALIDAYGWK